MVSGGAIVDFGGGAGGREQVVIGGDQVVDGIVGIGVQQRPHCGFVATRIAAQFR
jgi:hypothetical protein